MSLNWNVNVHYRPQSSCGKVKFLHLSVILSGGVSDRHPFDRHLGVSVLINVNINTL